MISSFNSDNDASSSSIAGTRASHCTASDSAGGNGYVGQRVCEKLVERGCDVTSISKSGKAPSGGAWTQSVKWVANDLTRGSRQELEAAVGQPDVAVSCVGTVGFDGRGLELGNGVANVRAAEALKGVQRFAVHESNFAGLGGAGSSPLDRATHWLICAQALRIGIRSVRSGRGEGLVAGLL